MFKDYKYLEYFGYDSITQLYRYRYQVIDDNFEWEGAGGSNSFSLGATGVTPVVNAVINCYSEKGLAVAPNLIRLMLMMQKKYGFSLDDQVRWNKKYNPRWHEVERDLRAYLLFS